MSKRTVLLVDDSEEDRYFLMHACEELGFKPDFQIARDGKEALAYLRSCDGASSGKPSPALVILDLKMPGLDGIDVLKAARADAKLKSMRFVVLTSSDEKRDREEAAALGVNVYLTKPFDYKGYAAIAKTIAGLLPR